ncbi:MAG: hypothetical protein ACHQQR_13215 [Gemmatimonadales bacterium]
MSERPNGYARGLNATIVLGTPSTFEMRDWTERTYDVDSYEVNAPCPGFVFLIRVSIDGDDVLGDADAVDAFANRIGAPAKFRPRHCEHGASVSGRYSGLVPEGMPSGVPYMVNVCLEGNLS